MLQISPTQLDDLAYDAVRRHARHHAQLTDERLAQRKSGPANSPASPASVERLQALAGVLRDDLLARTGAAADYLVVDLDHCAAQFAEALQSGAVYRETAVSGQLLASAALGLRWLGDERLCVDADGEWSVALEAPRQPSDLKAWAEAGWTDRYEFAQQRMQHLQAQACYALGRAVELGFHPASLRSIAETVFPMDDSQRLARFVAKERALLQAARLDGASTGDRRIESLCIGADLVHGLGRFVRLASAARGKMPSIEQLDKYLLRAIDELAE